jgi:small subunit ribosomal protein S6
MPTQVTLYDLMLLLSMSPPDEQRAKILSDVETAIEGAGGTIERQSNWGRRAMAFRISHETDAEYHLLQFTGPTELLESLNHSLRITDGVLRFRIIKVLPGTPAAPESPPPVIAATPTGVGVAMPVEPGLDE